MRQLMIALVLLSWSSFALAYDVAPPPIIQAPVVQNSIVQGPAYGNGWYRRRGSILGFGFRGLFTGALAGLGASYFAARDASDPGRQVALSTSIGALAGAGLGITLGVLDRLDLPGAYYVSRDLTYGVFFGAAIGALAGGIAALRNDHTESVLVGACAGSLAGVGLGLLTGILEGQWRARHDPMYLSRRRVSLSLGRMDVTGWGARVGGSF